jgi:hypothetical protein
MTRHVGDGTEPRTLRCTQAYRRENGEWKVVLRTLMSFPAKTNNEDDPQHGRAENVSVRKGWLKSVADHAVSR